MCFVFDVRLASVLEFIVEGVCLLPSLWYRNLADPSKVLPCFFVGLLAGSLETLSFCMMRCYVVLLFSLFIYFFLSKSLFVSFLQWICNRIGGSTMMRIQPILYLIYYIRQPASQPLFGQGLPSRTRCNCLCLLFISPFIKLHSEHHEGGEKDSHLDIEQLANEQCTLSKAYQAYLEHDAELRLIKDTGFECLVLCLAWL